MRYSTQTEFEEFYQQELKYRLREVDKVRKKILFNDSVIIFIMSVCFIAEAMTWMLIGMVLLALFIFWYTKYYRIPFFYLEQQHEKTIISNVSRFVFSKFMFDADRYIKLKDMQEGLLITGFPNQYGGKNLVEGNAGTMHMQISEVHSESKNEAKGINRVHFNGIAGVAKFPIATAEKIIIASEIDLHKSLDLPLITDERPDKKSSLFIAYNDKGNFEKLVTPSLLLLIKNFMEFSNSQIIISITPDGVFAGIESSSENKISTNLFHSLVSKKTAESYYIKLNFLFELFKSVEKRQFEKLPG